MEKVKIYLNKQESELYKKCNDFLECCLMGLSFCFKSHSLLNLKDYKVLGVDVKKEANHLYSLLLHLERVDVNGKK